MEGIGVKLWPIIRNNPLRYAVSREDILAPEYHCLSCCSVQLYYLYKSGITTTITFYNSIYRKML